MQLEPQVDRAVVLCQVLECVAEEVAPPQVHQVLESDEELGLALDGESGAKHVDVLEVLHLQYVGQGRVLHLLRPLHVQYSQRMPTGF